MLITQQLEFSCTNQDQIRNQRLLLRRNSLFLGLKGFSFGTFCYFEIEIYHIIYIYIYIPVYKTAGGIAQKIEIASTNEAVQRPPVAVV